MKIILRRHFCDNKENQQAHQVLSEPVIKCKSNWEPKKNHHTVETFVEAVENNVVNILQEKKELPSNNLSKCYKAPTDYFTKREDIVINVKRKLTKEELLFLRT